MGGRYGNKGAIVARFVIDDTSICFINVHLAAGQSAKASRNSDLAAIMEEKAIFPFADELPYVNGGDGTAILDHEVVILGGDLNVRRSGGFGRFEIRPACAGICLNDPDAL